MKKININIDRPEISSAEIRERRDFNSLLNRYKEVEKTPYYKRYRIALYSGALVFLSAGTILFFSVNKEKKDELVSETITSYTNSSNDNTNSIITETKIDQSTERPSVPAKEERVVKQSLVNEGLAVDNTVEQADPIKQDANINPKASEEELNKKISLLEEEVKNLKAQIQKLESEKPMKPVKATRKRFKVDVLAEEFPALTKYKDLLFEVAPDDKTFKDEFLQITWENMKLKNNKDGGYLLSLSSKKENVTFKVQPVFEGNGYTNAVKEYKKYETAIDSLKKIENSKEEEIINLSKK